MKATLLFAFLFLIQTKIVAQEYIFGKVLSDDNRELKGVSIVNIANKQTATTDDDGNFMIFAKVGDEIRFTKERYDRKSVKINTSNISKSFLIQLEIIPYDIEEVEIKYRITGDLEEDANHFGKSEKMLKFDDDMANYIQKRSSAEVMSPKEGEFVQPVGGGISIGGPKAQWDDIDLSQDLQDFFTDDFFVKELKLKVAEIPTFIFYVLRNFERKNIIKYAACSNADYTRFREEAFRKIVDYKKNIPNESKNKGNILQLKDQNTQNGLWWN